MFIRGLNYIFDSVHILWCLRPAWSSTICHTYCRYLTNVAIRKSTQNKPMFFKGLNYIFDSGHILWWSTPLVLVNNMSQVLSLLDDHKIVAIWKSTQCNPMFIRGLNYIFDNIHILWCLRHSWSSSICHTYCRTVVMSKSRQHNSMFIRGLNYIFDSIHILWCLRHSCSSRYCRYLTTIKPSPSECRRKITPCFSRV